MSKHKLFLLKLLATLPIDFYHITHIFYHEKMKKLFIKLIRPITSHRFFFSVRRQIQIKLGNVIDNFTK